MTRTINRLAIALGAGVLALGVTAGVYAAAQNQNTNQDQRPFIGRGGPGGQSRPGRIGPMGFLPPLGGRLQLTDAQRQQVKAIADSHRDEWKALADRARPAHDALRAAITADTIDESLIRQTSAEVAAVEADMAVARAHAYAEVVQILTPDQKKTLKEFEASAGAHRPGRGGRGL